MPSPGEATVSSAKVHPTNGLVTQPIEDALLLLDLESGVFFELDGVGARMWQLLSERGDADAVVPALLQEYDVEEGTLRRDLSRLVAELVDAGLMTFDHAGPEAGGESKGDG